jgi:hypothetical protein
MSDFLQQMATLSAERAAAAGRIRASDLDKPIAPLQLGGFDIIAEIKARWPGTTWTASRRRSNTLRAARPRSRC